MKSSYDRKIEIGTAVIVNLYDRYMEMLITWVQFAITSNSYHSTLEKASLNMTKRKVY